MPDDIPSVWPTTDAERAAFADWQHEVADGDTPIGFRAWLVNQAEVEAWLHVPREDGRSLCEYDDEDWPCAAERRRLADTPTPSGSDPADDTGSGGEPVSPRTIDVPALDLAAGHVLVGDSGGEALIVEQPRHNSFKQGFVTVPTEHGFLMLDDDPEITFTVLVN